MPARIPLRMHRQVAPRRTAVYAEIADLIDKNKKERKYDNNGEISLKKKITGTQNVPVLPPGHLQRYCAQDTGGKRARTRPRGASPQCQ